MNEAQLLELFRQVLRATVALPLIASGAACGDNGAGARDSGNPDDARHDSGRKEGGARDSASKDAKGRDSGRDAGAKDTGSDVLVREVGQPSDGADAMTKLDARSDGCSYPVTECYASVPLSCVGGVVGADASGMLSPVECKKVCPHTFEEPSCLVESEFDGGKIGPLVDAGRRIVECANQAGVCNGRSYAGMKAPRAPGQRSLLGRYFGESAQLEAASVFAFRILRDELQAHGAPAALIVAAVAAARDEVRHARTTRALARRYGPVGSSTKASPRAVRSLEAVAIENAAEGCVRETYGALVAHHQAAIARDPKLRAAMATIAEDETRHAALGWAVAAWAESKLDHGSRERVRRARQDAVSGLRAALRSEVPLSLVREAGIPGAHRATAMFAALEAKLWTQAPSSATTSVRPCSQERI